MRKTYSYIIVDEETGETFLPREVPPQFETVRTEKTTRRGREFIHTTTTRFVKEKKIYQQKLF